ncbi:MAG: hypothetical protein IJU50_01515 [Lachnospiraceae bacterium]|nr:hypothetical protein [Lachnospiraceae bacterium]
MKTNAANNFSLTGNQIKLFACISMLADHIGLVYFKYTRWYLPLRYFGRTAFPLYLFLLTEGWMHTRSRARYLRQLFLFALISEIPFNLVSRNVFFTLERQNIFWTLLLVLFSVAVLDWGWKSALQKAADSGGMPWESLLAWFMVVGLAMAAQYCHTDYGAIGVFAGVALYYFRKNTNGQVKTEKGNRPAALPEGETAFGMRIGNAVGYTAAVLALCFSVWWELFALIGLVPVFLYRGKRGGSSPWLKWAFYLFYPLHLLVLGLSYRFRV